MISLRATSPADRLRVYLNDHLAGATGGLALARRIRDGYQGTAVGVALEKLLPEIEADEQTLREVMAAAQLPVAQPKLVFAGLAERAGRLKLNGQLLGRSALSQLVELEAMALGITAKAKLWASLDAAAGEMSALAGFDFDLLQKRAVEQHEIVEGLRRDAARAALGGDQTG